MRWAAALFFAFLATGPAFVAIAAITDGLDHRCHEMNGGDCAYSIGAGIVFLVIAAGLLGLGGLTFRWLSR